MEKARKGLSPRASRRQQTFQHLDFSPVKPISDFDFQNYKVIMNMCGFKPLTLCYFVTTQQESIHIPSQSFHHLIKDTGVKQQQQQQQTPSAFFFRGSLPTKMVRMG